MVEAAETKTWSTPGVTALPGPVAEPRVTRNCWPPRVRVAAEARAKFEMMLLIAEPSGSLLAAPLTVPVRSMKPVSLLEASVNAIRKPKSTEYGVTMPSSAAETNAIWPKLMAAPPGREASIAVPVLPENWSVPAGRIGAVGLPWTVAT